MLSHIIRSLFLFSFWISHNRAEYSSFPYSSAQEDTVTLSTTTDTPDLSGISITPPSWTIAESSSNELRWQQQASTSLRESTKEALLTLATRSRIVSITRPTKSSLPADENALNPTSANKQICVRFSTCCKLDLGLTKRQFRPLDQRRRGDHGQHLETTVMI